MTVKEYVVKYNNGNLWCRYELYYSPTTYAPILHGKFEEYRRDGLVIAKLMYKHHIRIGLELTIDYDFT